MTKDLIRTLIHRARRNEEIRDGRSETEEFLLLQGSNGDYAEYGGGECGCRNSITDLPSLKRVGKALLKRLRCAVLVITRGEEGMALFEANQEPYLVPTVAKEVFDVTGAGDTVIGTMALAMAAGVWCERGRQIGKPCCRDCRWKGGNGNRHPGRVGPGD